MVFKRKSSSAQKEAYGMKSDDIDGNKVLDKYGRSAVDSKISSVEKEIVKSDLKVTKKTESITSKVEKKKKNEIARLDGQGGSSLRSGDEDDDDDDEAEQPVDMREGLMKKSPEEVFALFDTDSSGVIDFDEFRAMLPQLGIRMSMPKALRYFRMVDTDGSGEIGLDEFKVALFAVDPSSGNPVGFAPSALLTPLDAFEMFDEDGSGDIDEDEFFFLLQYLGVEVTEEKMEKLFSKYDTDGSGSIGYEEFKKCWVRLANVKKELTDRGIKIPKLATKMVLAGMLEEILDREEAIERRAMAEAERWAKWQALIAIKKKAHMRCRLVAERELKNALDGAGSVYLFGSGAFGEFDADIRMSDMRQGRHQYQHFDRLRSMWTRRVHPPKKGEPGYIGHSLLAGAGADGAAGGGAEGQAPEDEQGGADEEDDDEGDSKSVSEANAVAVSLDPELDSEDSPFKDLRVARTTVGLWGRRISQVCLSAGVAFALSELGEVMTWGGKSHWWHQMPQESFWQTHWRGETTERSRLLLQTVTKNEPDEEDVDFEDEEQLEEKEVEKLRTLTEYYGVWRPPPTSLRLKFIESELLPKIKYDQVRFSLECRGKYPEDKNLRELLDLLFEDIGLEKRVLGARVHRHIQQLEQEVLHFLKKNKTTMAKTLRLEVEEMWRPLREIQAEDEARKAAKDAAAKQQKYFEAEQQYAKWRNRIREARSEVVPGPPVPRKRGERAIPVSGMTSRGPKSYTPRGSQVATTLAAGSSHAMLVHSSGALYTWGTGVSGRLGLDLNGGLQADNPQADTENATLVSALSGRPVQKVSAGYNHSAALTIGGHLYMWGSCGTGKLGVGECDPDTYSSIPLRVRIRGPSARLRVASVSCGAGHSACVSMDGMLFVWGCGDGGRLGLGARRMKPAWEPQLVEAFKGKRVQEVSCGTAHTLVALAMVEQWIGEGAEKTLTPVGGELFQAGSAAVLGRFCPAFEHVQELEDQPVRQVSAGYGHSAVLSAEGEVYTWGDNKFGCLAQPQEMRFVHAPTLVRCLYTRPINLALHKPCRQSSVYNGLTAEIAVDGDCRGSHLKRCQCTQQDPQAWWEVDLGGVTQISKICVWNRTDEPTDLTLDRSFYSSRLIPFWIMLSDKPFSDEIGGESLRIALEASAARMKFTVEKRCSSWLPPEGTLARYVRVQIEGFQYLHIAQVEVYGTFGSRRSPGRVSAITAGKYATAAVVSGARDPGDLELAYKRAIMADPFNAEILRQLESFIPAYDKHGNGEHIINCMICHGSALCELCDLKHEYRDELKSLPLGPGGRLRRLDSMADFLYEAAKPELHIRERKGGKKKKKRAGVKELTQGLANTFKKVKALAVGDGEEGSEEDSEDGSESGSYEEGSESEDEEGDGGWGGGGGGQSGSSSDGSSDGTDGDSDDGTGESDSDNDDESKSNSSSSGGGSATFDDEASSSVASSVAKGAKRTSSTKTKTRRFSFTKR